MSGKLSAIILFVSVVAIALAANRAEEASEIASLSAAGRSLASVSPEVLRKEEILSRGLTNAGRADLRHTDKAHGPLTVKLEVVGHPPTHSGDVFVLRGSISSSEDISSLHFQWAVPAGIELVSGSKEGELVSLQSGESRPVEITLKKSSNRNEQIHLQAFVSNAHSKFGSVAQYNTDIQNQLNAPKTLVGAGVVTQDSSSTSVKPAPVKFFQ